MTEMDENRLWAKRWRGEEKAPPSAYLCGHLQDVYTTASDLLNATGEHQLNAFGLDPVDWFGRLRRVVLFAAAVHDLGKVNDQFQNMLKQRDRIDQALRHEWVTLLILEGMENEGFKGWQKWLLPAVEDDERDWQLARWCLSGHHPKYDRSAPPDANPGPAKMKLPLDHADVRRIADWLHEKFDLNDSPPPMPRLSLDFAFGGNGEAAVDELARRYHADAELFESFDADTRRFLAAAKDTLIAADVAGSALPREDMSDHQRQRWVADVLQAARPDAGIYRRVVESRLGDKSADVHRQAFQDRVAAAERRVAFVSAGCGTGKTVAAYRWAEHRCPGRRLFVCYPTTGTALEGFRDYLLDPDLPSDQISSRREIDLDLQAEGVVEDQKEAVARIEALDLWQRPVVACTVDAVLGVIQNNRRGRFGWPALAQGGFVFDEIHSYDDKLFDALLHFLNAMRGVPILMMTASLPERRRRALAELLGDELQVVEGPTELERIERYRREEVGGKDVPRRIVQELRDSGKVLRVCNTVDAAMREAEDLAEALREAKLDIKPHIYHSRFRYLDRVQRHKDVIDAFDPKKNPGLALAVCTQVAEMSLDLSATLLVTDRSPVPSLIQRLGRLNRRARTGDPARPFIVMDPKGRDGKFSSLPYDADELEAAAGWLDALGERNLSQRDLAEEWESMQAETDNDDTPPPRYASAWLDFGPENPVLELREGSPNVTVVLECDWPALKTGEAKLAEVALPMPVPPVKVKGRPFDWQAGDFRSVPVVKGEAIEYDRLKGARWRT